MPWCDPCERFWNFNALTLEGKCPRCGIVLDMSGVKQSESDKSELTGPSSSDAPRVGAPWHFWLFLVAASVYLVWRAIQGIVMLF